MTKPQMTLTSLIFIPFICRVKGYVVFD